MKFSRKLLVSLLVFVFVMSLWGCGATGEPTATGDNTSSNPAATTDSSSTSDSTSEQDTSSSGAESSVALPSIESCQEEVCSFPILSLLQQPINADGKNVIDYSSRYGSYRASNDTANRGLYYLMSAGTPVLAAADGKVIVAGDDSTTSYGRDTNIYGNLVILEHHIPGISDPVYTLYGHLSQVLVQVDATVSAGDEIAQVGNTGAIGGSALIFEVRVGKNDIFSLRNPELWLRPVANNTGAIAGRVLDSSGNYVTIDNVVVERLGGEGQPVLDQFYLQTYTKSDLVGLSPFKENFSITELPAGAYQVTFYLEKFYQLNIEVKSGEVTFLTFTVE